MKNLTFTAPCIFGLEGLCANELKFLGLENVRAENGRVLFEGGFDSMIKANINSRYAERIQILLSEFEADSFEELFQGVKTIPWENFIDKQDAFPVKGKSLSSKLKSVPDCQKIIKKAIVERLKEKYLLSWFEETGPVHQIQFLIINDKVSILLDTTGEGLHKRGYRANSNEAPIKETLAAAMAELSFVRANHNVVDPMCGSGTILIESAMKALHIPPGLNRTFAFEGWSQIDLSLVEKIREEAKNGINTDCSFSAVGYDIDEISLRIARENAEKAGVADRIEFRNRDIKDFTPDFERQTVITNPPYGERLLDVTSAEKLYKIMGERFLKYPENSYTIISPDDDFEKIFGRKADKRRKLYNGMLKCQVFIYKSKNKLSYNHKK
ncbi:MAG: class I SAM-dependent RNA methyltransferase [Ruminococcus sp.]|nr:class I SAM-dependent RNA methyltransferase [Ruminococcus sp.]